MSKKVYEISFAIAGKMASGFGGTFAFASSKIQGLKNDLAKLNSEYKKGTIPLEQYSAKQQQLTRKIHETQQAQQLLNRTMQKPGQIGNALTGAAAGSVRNMMSVGVGGGALALGAGGFILGASIKKAIDYEAQLSSIQALTGINNEELTKMDELALKMGADTKYSALQAAQGIEELLKAGLSPATIQAGGLEAALNLATAGGLELTEAAEVMSDSLNGFKKDGLTAAQVSNILAGAANASSTDVHKLKESLSAVGPVAEGIGASFLGVNATLAAFSNNMLKGSDAGTSLKTFLANVQPQTKEATELFTKFGLSAADGSNNIFFANGRLKDMAEVAEILKDKFGKLSEQERSDALFNLFGSDAVRAANILTKEGAEGIKEMYKQIGDVTALEVAKKKMDNAAGSIEQFQGALETLQIRALRPTLPLIKRLFDEAGNAVEKYTPVITKGVQGAVDTAKKYLNDHFINNDDFQKLSDRAKFEFVIKDLKKTFDTWYAGGGNKQISDSVSSLIGYISDALEGSSGALTEVGIQLGKSVGGGMVTGLKQFAAGNPELSALLAFIATPGPLPVKAAAALAVGGSGEILKGIDAVEKNRNAQEAASAEAQKRLEDTSKPFFSGPTTLTGDNRSFVDKNVDEIKNYFISKGWMRPPKVDGSNFSGLPYVPFDGYVSELHRGERVLTAQENRVWNTAVSKGSSGDGNTYQITFAPVINGGSPAEIMPQLQQQQRSFMDEFESLARQRKRVAFSD